MSVSHGFVGRLRSYSRGQVLGRSLLAIPFVLSLILTLALGPAIINSRHGSFLWLALLSLIAALVMFAARKGLLVPVGLVTFLAFPLLAGLGFNFAPGWARPLVAIIFYGSMLASLTAVVIGTLHALTGPRHRVRRWVLSITAGCALAVAIVAVVMNAASARSSAAGQASDSQTRLMNLGPVMNTRHRESEPTFTADGRTMYFNGKDYEILVSRLNGAWDKQRWSSPEVVGPPISTSNIEIEPLINASGDKLYFTSTRPFERDNGLPGVSLYVIAVGRISRLITDKLGVNLFNFNGLGLNDVWVSYARDGVWSEPRRLNDVSGEPPVNTAFMDHCLSFSADGNEAFWTSNRPGGFGGNDIWTSRRVAGTWTQPENLGTRINGPRSEHHSLPSPDGRSLYITSSRAGGFGGEDIYTATRGDDGEWAPLVNMGSSVNGPGNDRCAAWTPDGRILLFDSDRAGGFGREDIWWVNSDELQGRPRALDTTLM